MLLQEVESSNTSFMSSADQFWNIPPDPVRLAENEVHVWRVSLQAPLRTIHELQCLLSQEEVKQAKQFYFEKDRLHWIVAHRVLRRLLGQYLELDPREVRFVTNGYGKPFIAYPPHGIRLHFNLSHSCDLALYAFTYDRHVGIDVEYMRADIDYEGLAQYHFSPYEGAVLQALPPLNAARGLFPLLVAQRSLHESARGRHFHSTRPV